MKKGASMRQPRRRFPATAASSPAGLAFRGLRFNPPARTREPGPGAPVFGMAHSAAEQGRAQGIGR